MRRYNNKKSANSVKRAESLAKEVLIQTEKAVEPVSEPAAEIPTETVSETVLEAEKTAVSMCFQCGGWEVSPKDVEDAVAEDMKKKGFEAKNVQIYVNMQEAAAYYVLDGIAGEDYKVIF